MDLGDLSRRDQAAIRRDRALAAQELRGQFEVVPDDDAGERHPNTVTEAEYQRLVANYSDIRRGRADLRIAPMRGEQRADTLEDIASILQTESGRDLISDLSYHAEGEEERTTTIHARPAAEWGADAGPEGCRSASAAELQEMQAQRDSGVPLDAGVSYHPGQTEVWNYPSSADWLPFRSDVALYHELVHAEALTSGTYPGGPALSTVRHEIPQIDRERGVEASEARAVGLGEFAEGQSYSENMYRAERHAIGEANVGERTGDDTMAQRTSYLPPPGTVMSFGP
jgi:hypothetical protein